MANYLPVLLVSVNPNAIPDDNVLTNVPCGQVDYLSHNWQEEDVWRSWRNMTRQKNEITNGLRLENASWRTWWKQRNKLKTVSPETLNWLKDSDVTWLYGPLHTGVDWSPPPKPDPVPDSVDSKKPTSTQDRLDLYESPAKPTRRPQPPPTKPILKHRSISELLSFDLPASPVFSSQDSDNESTQPQTLVVDPTRPCLPHTKSDTHITRWGPSRAFRKDSPPRVSPPSRAQDIRASGAVRSSISQDSTSSASVGGSAERPTKRKHISFNTFVEQCIAIDKHPHQGPSRNPGFALGDFADNELEEGEGDEDGPNEDDGYEEDREDNFFDDDDPLWLAGGARPRRRHLNGSAIHSDSDSDDGVIEIRPSNYRHSAPGTPHPKKKSAPRSQSASSSSSATTSTTTSSTSSTGSRPRRKSASAAMNGALLPGLLSAPPQTSAYRPRSMHPSQPDVPYRDRVTIAPIAPTFLKTTGAWEESFGDEGGASDDGLWDYNVPKHSVSDYSAVNDDKSRKGASKYDEEPSSDGTPVELVYVPPLGSMYGYGAQVFWRNRREEAEDIEDEEDEETTTADDAEEVKAQLTTIADGEASSSKEDEQDSLAPAPSIPSETTSPVSRSPVPVVIIDSSADSDSATSDSEKVETQSNSSNSTSTTTTPVPVPASKMQLQEEERGRSRGRSLSVSPVGESNAKPAAPPSSSTNVNTSLLSSRGRSQSCQDLQTFYGASVATTALQGGERRGRSSMRGSSHVSNSGTVRGVNSGSRSSTSHSGGCSGGSVSPQLGASASTSPIGGSLSPDGSEARLGGMGSAYASGRMGGRERESRLLERNSSSSSISSKATSVSGGNSADERRGRDRGRRDVGSGSGSSTSPIASATSSPEDTRGRSGRSSRRGGDRVSLSPQDVFDIEPASAPMSSSPVRIGSAGILSGKGKATDEPSSGIAINGTPAVGISAPRMEMEASICSVSSEGSTATIVPTSKVVSPTYKAGAPKAQTPTSGVLVMDVSSPPSKREKGKEFEEAFEDSERWRMNVPTPSNSPAISMTAPSRSAAPVKPPSLSSTQIPSSASASEYSPTHTRTTSSSSSHTTSPPSSSSKYKAKSPPPIIPSPPLPALPSTSSSHAPGQVGPSGIFSTYTYVRSASTSLERASSGSRERQSPSSATSSTASSIPGSSGLRKEITPETQYEREIAESRRGRNISASGVKSRWQPEPTSPTIVDGGRERERGTIIDKAVGMVSSAGAYLRFWPGQQQQSNMNSEVGAAGGTQ